MNILLIAIGTRGDVQPFITLGKALQAKGHEVTLAASKGFAPAIAEAGLKHHKLALDFQELLEQPDMREALTGFRGKLKAYQWSRDILNEQLTDLWQLGNRLHPDLILHHFKAPLAPYLARKLDAISVPVMLQPGFMETWDYPQFLIASKSLGGWGNRLSHKLIKAVMRFGTGMMIRRWQKDSGTEIGPPMSVMDGVNPRGKAYRIHAYSPSIVPRPDTWEMTEMQKGYLFDAPLSGGTPDPALIDFLAAGDAPVYFGFGSMPGMDPEKITKAVSGAIAQTGIRAIIATGWGGLRAMHDLDHVHVLQSVDHSWLFPQVAATVHHGGSGTTHEGLRWGRPAIICPLFADQPFFGQRIADLGVGPVPIRQKNLTADRLAAAIHFALRPEIAQKAEELGRQIRAEQGVSEVLELVDHLQTKTS